MPTSSRKFLLISLLVVCLAIVTAAKKNDDKEKPAWANKKLTDYSDADMERLLDQWNVRNILNNLNLLFPIHYEN